MAKPNLTLLNKCVTHLPERILIGECWLLKDGDYVKEEDSVHWIYPKSGSELVYFESGVA